jgi:Kef-type K+ transport system membrane component KefB/predicted amino acid-binding ACT domain protein
VDIAHILRDILVVLVAAKLAAEGAERLGIPAVVGEIVAGIVVGPSVVGLVGGGDEVLRTLGEIGVILLLLDVGLEMDLAELGKVGRASLSVATIGVVAPMVLGFGVLRLMGEDPNTALFVGAALTATSVGITARVFGDLRALATTEARVVLGAAVADDVMGLVVLTVVVRLVTQGSVSVPSVLGIVGIAIGFLVVSSLVGLRAAAPLFGLVERASRSAGTLVALALAFTLGFAELADLAKLAPIVGAFVAGIALTRSRQRDRIRRELTPVGHLFVPVFFLQIGIDADVGAFARPAVLRDAAILLAVAVAGKLVAAIGAGRTRADRWLVGLGMLPRGEVGLIFATIGLQNGVLGQDLYASLLLVVLVTTLATPQLLELRFRALRPQARTAATGTLPVTAEAPPGGWIRIVDGRVHLAATPPPERVLDVAFTAAVEVARHRPSDELLDYLADPAGEPRWDVRAREALRTLVRRGSPRSWRFLETVGLLDRALPELADTLRTRTSDPHVLDAAHLHRWEALDRLRTLPEGGGLRAHFEQLEHPDWLLLAALLVEGLDGREHPDRDAADIARRLGYDPIAERAIAGLVGDDTLLRGAAMAVDAFDEATVLQLASHLDTPERARGAYLLAAVRDELDASERQRLSALHELVQRVLADPALTGAQSRNLLERRRAEAMVLARDRPEVVERLRSAPRTYVAGVPAATLVRHAELTSPPLDRDDVRVHVQPSGEQRWTVDVVARDRPALLATVAGALADEKVEVERAMVVTWPDDAAVEAFVVRSRDEPDPRRLASAIVDRLEAPISVQPVPDASIDFDDVASPWHTVVTVAAPDAPGLLHDIAGVLAAASVEIRSATIGRSRTTAVDRFEVVGRDGGRLSHEEREQIRSYLASGAVARRKRFGRGFALSAAPVEA